MQLKSKRVKELFRTEPFSMINTSVPVVMSNYRISLFRASPQWPQHLFYFKKF